MRYPWNHRKCSVVLSASRFTAGMLKFAWRNIYLTSPSSSCLIHNELSWSGQVTTTPALKMSVPQKCPFSVYLRKVPIGGTITWWTETQAVVCVLLHHCKLLQWHCNALRTWWHLRWPVGDWSKSLKRPTLWNDQHQRQKGHKKKKTSKVGGTGPISRGMGSGDPR